MFEGESHDSAHDASLKGGVCHPSSRRDDLTGVGRVSCSISYPDCVTGAGNVLQLLLSRRSGSCVFGRAIILLGGLQLFEHRVVLGLVKAAGFIELSFRLFSAAH